MFAESLFRLLIWASTFFRSWSIEISDVSVALKISIGMLETISVLVVEFNCPVEVDTDALDDKFPRLGLLKYNQPKTITRTITIRTHIFDDFDIYIYLN